MANQALPALPQKQDLTVRGESIERVYGNFRARRYLVNRRYQRKLVWTIEEKKSFIDSIRRGFPVPIVLLAEDQTDDRNLLEIIDGMQRLNAIMSFLENDFPLDDGYFDLNTMAASKALLDAGTLEQLEPRMAREECVRIASYTLPLSIYEFAGEAEVDEVFRRINSGGKKLSRQELRIAGSTGHFAQSVRVIAAKIRGDVSASDKLMLNEMNRISIGNKELDYGIDVDKIFWIEQGILTKEQVRESRDEEIVADVLSYMLLTQKPSSRREFLDDYFGFGSSEASQQRLNAIEDAVQRYTLEVAVSDFQRVLDAIRILLSKAGQPLGQLLLGDPPARAPRYFQIVFLGLAKLIVSDNQEIANVDQLVTILDGAGAGMHVPEGGNWGAVDRENAVNSAAGMMAPAFRPASSYDPARVRWIMQFENILNQSFTEQAAYDFKQGLLRLDGNNNFDDASFDKILKTLVAIANIRRGTTGYVIVGVTDRASDAARVQLLFGTVPTRFERFYITGMEHEAIALGIDLDQFFRQMTERIRNSSISQPLRDYIARNVKLIRYYDKSVLIFETKAQDDPSNLASQYFVRHGSEVIEVPPTEFPELFRRFQRGF
jgi:Protein of unknown function DUF262